MKVLLATDFSPRATVAHDLVRGLRLPPGSHIRVIHAIEPITSVQLFAPSSLLTITEAWEREAKAQAGGLAKQLRRAGVETDAFVGIGPAAEVIVSEAAEFQPDILVLGNRGRGGLATAVLGSVSAEVVDRAPCPVLVARTATLSSLIVAEDGSRYASEGARIVRESPVLAELHVRVVSVVDAPFPTLSIDPSASSAAVQAYREYEAALPTLRSAHAGYARDRAFALASKGVLATWEQREGDAAVELIAAAKEQAADCIVIGSRGQTGLRRMALGSVARSVLFHAPCSVLIAHAPATAARPRNGHVPAVAAATSRREV